MPCRILKILSTRSINFSSGGFGGNVIVYMRSPVEEVLSCPRIMGRSNRPMCQPPYPAVVLASSRRNIALEDDAAILRTINPRGSVLEPMMNIMRSAGATGIMRTPALVVPVGKGRARNSSALRMRSMSRLFVSRICGKAGGRGGRGGIGIVEEAVYLIVMSWPATAVSAAAYMIVIGSLVIRSCTSSCALATLVVIKIADNAIAKTRDLFIPAFYPPARVSRVEAGIAVFGFVEM